MVAAFVVFGLLPIFSDNHKLQQYHNMNVVYIKGVYEEWIQNVSLMRIFSLQYH